MNAPVTLANLMLDGKWPFAYPPALAPDVLATLRGAWEYPLPAGSTLPDDPRPRRVLDISAGVGAFAAWIFKRARGECFIDCYERDPALADLCRTNAPPGAMVHMGEIDWNAIDGHYDLVKIAGAHAGESFLQLWARAAPGNCERILRGASVVMAEWRTDQDRMALELLGRTSDLRCFAATMDNVSRGRQVLVKSKARWDAALSRYVAG